LPGALRILDLIEGERNEEAAAALRRHLEGSMRNATCARSTRCSTQRVVAASKYEIEVRFAPKSVI
jgi:hypothetical protein